MSAKHAPLGLTRGEKFPLGPLRFFDDLKGGILFNGNLHWTLIEILHTTAFFLWTVIDEQKDKRVRNYEDGLFNCGVI